MSAKTTVGPDSDTSAPAIAGPMARAPFMLMLPSAAAAGICSARNEIRLDRLPGRRGQRLPAADQEQQRQQHRRRGQPGAGQRREQTHARGHRRLGRDQQTSPVDQIGEDARRQAPAASPAASSRSAPAAPAPRRADRRPASTARPRSASRCRGWRRTARSTARGRPATAAEPTSSPLCRRCRRCHRQISLAHRAASRECGHGRCGAGSATLAAIRAVSLSGQHAGRGARVEGRSAE